MHGRTGLVLAVLLIIGGAALRFYHYYILQQYLLKLLIAVSIVILACSVLVTLLEKRSETYKDSFVFVTVVAILWGLTYESAAANKRKNQSYLEHLAAIVNRYAEKNHSYLIASTTLSTFQGKR